MIVCIQYIRADNGEYSFLIGHDLQYNIFIDDINLVAVWKINRWKLK
jgi:hypothetical protein